MKLPAPFPVLAPRAHLPRKLPRGRIASPAEAATLIDALEETDRALWATAFYAGLRLGELRALRDEDVDLERGVIQVIRSWDQKARPNTSGGPFNPNTINNRAAKAWTGEDPETALDPIGLHECRHTCASIFIAAGVSAKALSTYLGHSSIQTTIDRDTETLPAGWHFVTLTECTWN